MTNEKKEIIETPKNSDADNVKIDREKLKEENDAYAAELLRTEQLKAERQKGGESDAGEIPEPPKEKTNEEIAEEFDKGEIDILAK